MSETVGKPILANIKRTTSTITSANRRDHLLARLGVNRSGHRLGAGLYALGSPTPDSPVFVTANYTLSFDALRSALAGTDCYIMVLETYGINVWCAAGKGTLGTDELVHRIQATNLHEVVRHRVLILPQLGAAGVSAHEVKKRSDFKVEYGPVRASDLPEYLKRHQATPEMRRVSFNLRDRLILIPVELRISLLAILIMVVVSLFRGGPSFSIVDAGVITVMLGGFVLFPILLPWLPTRDFSTKGFILGGIVAFPFALAVFLRNQDYVWWLRVLAALPFMLTVPPAIAYLALNFTGSITFTSRSGVRREIFTYVPLMAWCFGIGIVLSMVQRFVPNLGG